MWRSCSLTDFVPGAGTKLYCSSGISSAIWMVLLRTVRKAAASSRELYTDIKVEGLGFRVEGRGSTLRECESDVGPSAGRPVFATSARDHDVLFLVDYVQRRRHIPCSGMSSVRT